MTDGSKDRTSSLHHFAAEQVDEINEAFAKDGFVVISQALDASSSLLMEWQSFGNDYFDECFKILHKSGHTRGTFHQDDDGYVLGQGIKHGFREIVMRSPGRYELSLLNRQQDVPETKVILECFEEILPKLLGHSDMEHLKLCHLSLLVATPGSAEQGWHADGGHVSVGEHMPCHCYNVFIPLQDVPLEMGPTEFRPGGHFLTRNLGPMMLAAKCRKTLRKPVWPPLQLGDAVMFDYRVLHRGKANSTNLNRNVLVLTFCEPWFQDILNFPKRSMLDPNV